MPANEDPIQGSQHAANLVHRLSNELGLWTTPTEAALFLAALGTAHETEPVPRSELDDIQPIGDTGDVEGLRDDLAVLGLLHDPEPDPDEIRETHLPGWIERGAKRIGPRIAGTSRHEAAREVVTLIQEVE